MLTVGSLFSGIGGIDLGLERAGMDIVWQCENDPYASKVLARHWPHVPNLGDITEVDWDDIEPVDLVCGGFPCQDISFAGRGGGITPGSRSGLWTEYVRCLRALRPRWVLVENVPALLVRRPGMDVVAADLAALGYGIWWDCIPAAAVGAPHRRDRVYVVAFTDRAGLRDATRERSAQQDGPVAVDDGPNGHVAYALGDRLREQPVAEHWRGSAALAVVNGTTRHVADTDSPRLEGHGRPVGRPRELAAAESGTGPRTVADADTSGRTRRAGELGQGRRREPADGGPWAVEPDMGRVAHGVPARVDRLRCLGNAVVPQVAELIGRAIVEVHDMREAVA